MSIALTSDELGAVGEGLFPTLCARAKLICNSSNRDRTGWDFVVEFPMPDVDENLTLDGRAPTACSVQLKATAATEPVSLRLSSAERLAKDPRPALIVVMRLTPTGEPVAGYLIHLLDAPLAKVLKRLRVAQASRTFDVNNAKISFDYRRCGERFELTGEGLRRALERACGTDRAAYVVEKQRQLDELGYENGGLEAEFRCGSKAPTTSATCCWGSSL